jgi:caa(3)-type oxidase subunit IV
MSAGATHDAAHDAAHEAEHLKRYFKIYVSLVVLFLISWAGPAVFAHNKTLVLLTAFGIALVKAYLVCANFMHLNVEKKYIIYLLTIALTFMFLFYAGAGPDVMEHHGRNWENVAAQQEVERALKANAAEHEAGEHGEHEGAEHAE